MPKIQAVGTALPRYKISREESKAFALNLYGEVYKGDPDRLLAIYDHTAIDSRYFCVPAEWFASSKSFEVKNNLYIEEGLKLSEQAIEQALQSAGIGYDEVDCLIFVSTTGLSTPTMDARLIERLPFRKDVRRLPIWGIGCAGGAASLAWAMQLAQAQPTQKILIVVLELCGLTFVRNDLSKAAMISSALFADGAAAVVVTGDKVSLPSSASRPCLVDSATETLPNSLDVMGWQFGEYGFKVLLSRDVPEIVQVFLKNCIDKFLQKKNLKFSDVKHFITHPGGKKVLDAYEKIGILPSQLEHARAVLRECGNMSAATILFILKRFLETYSDEDNAFGLMTALGPGFSAELVLLHWH
ncbi:MAG: type III polyketide synthase [Candidatus Thermochlorobacter sp.]